MYSPPRPHSKSSSIEVTYYCGTSHMGVKKKFAAPSDISERFLGIRFVIREEFNSRKNDAAGAVVQATEAEIPYIQARNGELTKDKVQPKRKIERLETQLSIRFSSCFSMTAHKQNL